jgi:hypothetical protein
MLKTTRARYSNNHKWLGETAELPYKQNRTGELISTILCEGSCYSYFKVQIINYVLKKYKVCYAQRKQCSYTFLSVN